MSTKRSTGPRVPAQETRRSAASRKKNRSTNLCTFTFADGRQCRTPRCSGHLHLCYFHAQKEAERLAAKQVGEDISRFLPEKLLTACDLSGAMARVFCAIARGDVKPRLASTLAYLSQSMVQSIPIAQHEYCEAFGTDSWRAAIRSSFNVPAPQPKPAPQPAPKPSPQPPASASATPTPVEAGRNLSRPGREPGSSDSSSSTLPTPAQPPENCHSACPDLVGERSDERPTSGASPESYREEPAFSSSHAASTTPAPVSPPKATPPSSSAPLTPTGATPPAPAPTPLPPGFGAPANWDVLIPPKPRRRFSRHWQLHE